MTKPKKNRVTPPRKVWSDPELALLRELYPATLNADLAARLGITVAVLVYQSAKLGIRKTP